MTILSSISVNGCIVFGIFSIPLPLKRLVKGSVKIRLSKIKIQCFCPTLQLSHQCSSNGNINTDREYTTCYKASSPWEAPTSRKGFIKLRQNLFSMHWSLFCFLGSHRLNFTVLKWKEEKINKQNKQKGKRNMWVQKLEQSLQK